MLLTLDVLHLGDLKWLSRQSLEVLDWENIHLQSQLEVIIALYSVKLRIAALYSVSLLEVGLLNF